VNAKRDLVLVTVRHPASGACRAVCFDPRDGRIAWQRQLGAVPPAGLVATAAGVISIDEDGGAVLLDPKAPSDTTKPKPLDAVCPPVAHPDPAFGPAVVAANDKAAWVLVPERGDKDTRLRIRSIVHGTVAVNVSVPLPAGTKFAGSPLALGDTLYLPLSDGVVYRYVPGTERLAAGQSWKADGAAADATCFLAAADGEAFYATDGLDRFRAWVWPPGPDAKMAPQSGWWDAIGPVVLPPVLVKGADGKSLLVVADPGGFAAYAPDRPAEPVRKWRSGKDLPTGPPTHGPVAVGPCRVAVVLDGKHVA
jgi:hypothetical protein